MAQARTREAIDAAARLLALDLPEACREGVAQNLDLLRSHLAIVEAAPAEDDPFA
jgi:hypothetical protein